MHYVVVRLDRRWRCVDRSWRRLRHRLMKHARHRALDESRALDWRSGRRRGPIQRGRALARALPAARGNARLHVAVDPVLIVAALPKHDILRALEHLALTAQNTAR
jgi:histone deacetylase complex regulatory component SIN3